LAGYLQQLLFWDAALSSMFRNIRTFSYDSGKTVPEPSAPATCIEASFVGMYMVILADRVLNLDGWTLTRSSDMRSMQLGQRMPRRIPKIRVVP